MIVVTGGAGFIGSHLVDELIAKGNEVLVVDNLSSGKMENINGRAKFLKEDIRKLKAEELGKDVVAIFHLAADPDVRDSSIHPERSFSINVEGTYNMLEIARKLDADFIFASTSTVYGEAELIPTPESYPTFPISNYGASKLAGEAYVSSFSSTYGIRATVLRYANIYGERSRHGVMFDFYMKLKKNPKQLVILGNGLQEKSYLHVVDCVNATLTAWERQERKFDVFNVGSEEKTTVNEIALLISEALHLKPEFVYTGGDRGWVGDVRFMLLDISKIKSLGWKPKIPLKEGIARYVRWLKANV